MCAFGGEGGGVVREHERYTNEWLPTKGRGLFSARIVHLLGGNHEQAQSSDELGVSQ